MNELTQHIDFYLDKGWSLLPLHGMVDGNCTCGESDCKSKGKHPIYDRQLCPSGVKSASTNKSTVDKWVAKWPDMNIGIATGAFSGITILDVDNRNGGDATLRDINDDSGKNLLWSCGFVVQTGNGHHLYYNHLDKVNGNNKLPGIDVKGTGGYVVAPPSLHSSGVYYTVMDSGLEDGSVIDLPQTATKLLTGDNKTMPGGKTRASISPLPTTACPLSSTEREDIETALNRITDADDRDTYIKVGMALKSTGAGEEAFKLWCIWSKQSDKFDLEYSRKTWKSFNPNAVHIESLYYLANEQSGVQPPSHIGIPLPSTTGGAAAVHTPANDSTEKIYTESEITNISTSDALNTPFPTKLLQVNGTMEMIMSHILRASVRPQPVLALASTLACFGTILGRRYSTGYGGEETRSNLFVVGIAPSGAGKDVTMKVTRKIMRAAGLDSRIGGNKIGSASGMLMSLALEPHCRQYQIDEFGLAMQSMTDKGSSQYTREIISTLMELYSSAADTYEGAEYATKQRVIIEQPHCCVYGVTTPDEYYKAFDSGFANNGFFGRWLAFEVDDVTVRRKPTAQDSVIDPKMIDRIKEYGMYENMPVNGNLSHYVYDVQMTAGAAQLTDDFEQACFEKMRDYEGVGDKPKSRLWARTGENVKKLALLWACSERPKAPVIDETGVQWAIELVTFLAEDQSHKLTKHVASSSNETIHQEIYNAISWSPNGVSARKLKRKYLRKYGKRVFFTIISELEEVETVRLVKVSKTHALSGRTSVSGRYVAVQDDE